MVLNPGKSHFMCLDIDDTETLSFNDLALKYSKEVEILEITLNRCIDLILILKTFVEKQARNEALC